MRIHNPAVPHRVPIYTLLVVVLALCSFAAMVFTWQRLLATPEEAFYLRGLLVSTTIKHVPYLSQKPLLFRVYHSKPIRIQPAVWDRLLREKIYRKHTLPQIFWIPIGATVLFGLLILPLGISADIRHARRAYNGEYLRGSELISRREQNRRKPGDGFRLRVT